MSAVLFGSIGTVVETSEVQRAAFNEAFQQHRLSWRWTRSEYQDLLIHSGGRHRIEAYAKSRGESVDTAAIHRTKSEIFQQAIREGSMQPRPGVADLIRDAKKHGVKVAIVTTTSRGNIDALLSSVARAVEARDFDLIVDVTQVDEPKPSPDCYKFAIQQLDETTDSCIAIEDNVDGVSSAKAADLTCVAFPGNNTTEHDYSGSEICTQDLSWDLLGQHLVAKANA